ncbi:YdeI/OmpD-associated family protein [Streptomyces actinomycinicus]|uniref:YdeI/OmpD-associated family protein n=1 Tax=Streptomyces actinomycinicus TaxID=1695166 RepID=A0A937EKF3_9ACTN|nr:YdeI/OmpD-associated family protein [Streptomyces actinomycinicus]MBL1084113.1 YdeI/OmpD-associated family protein [Streptomyces actinomycinicus]
MPAKQDDAEVIHFPSEGDLEGWLEKNHAQSEGVWLKIAKKGSGIASVDSVQALDVALCYGWIPGQRKSLDAQFFLQKLTPRRPRSVWSMVNIRKVEALIAAGRMREPGLAEIRAAQADGRWAAAYESQALAEVPDDLAAALRGRPRAAERFERLDRTKRYGLMLPLLKAVGAESRAAQLAKIIRQLETAEH